MKLKKETIRHAYKEKWISDKEHHFYHATYNKSGLSNKQLSWRWLINSHILTHLRKED